jgi:hypothetical protein
MKESFRKCKNNGNIDKEDNKTFFDINISEIDEFSLGVDYKLTEVKKLYDFISSSNQDDETFLVYLNGLRTINLETFESKVKVFKPIDSTPNQFEIGAY